jgi:hypothetical protein
MDATLLTRVKGAVEEYEKSLLAQNDAPKTALTGAGGDGATRQYATAAENMQLREGLRKLSTPALQAMFSDLARRKDAGIPYEVWASAGGRAIGDLMAADPSLRKTLDTSGATALIRQDLEPILYELYIREFPAWDRFRKEPSNGLVHAYNKQTTFGDAQFMTELGTVTDDSGVYTRATTPIAVIATRRGITLKSQFATIQGGAGFNPEQLELRNGLRAIAHKMQKTIFQGNATVSGGTTNDEDGPYDANSFDGLRRILNTADAVDVDPTAGTPEDIRAAINSALITVMQNAGRTTVAYLAPETKGQFDLQQDKNIRYVSTLNGVNVGAVVNTVNTVFGEMPLSVVAGDSIGSYTRSAHTVSDIYFLDEDTITLPYLGSDGVTVLDIPMGVGGQLTHQFILFGMWGLAVKVPTWNNKVRVRQP